MIRDIISNPLDHDPNFRWRGDAVTRIENLSDIVFALALGMLVSASSPPLTYQELLPHLLNIVPVAIGFATMLAIWNSHFTYFRRYGVADKTIIWLNALLLLLILFVAYPLRFAFDSLFAFALSFFDGWQRMETLGLNSYREAGVIIAWLHVGLLAVNVIYAMMYNHAYKKRALLALNPSEGTITRRSIWRYAASAGVAGITIPLAAFTPLGPFAGFLGVINQPIRWIINSALKLPVPEAPQPQGQTANSAPAP